MPIHRFSRRRPSHRSPRTGLTRRSRRGLRLALAISAGTIALGLSVPLSLSHAASGTVVTTAPGTVFNLSGCTGFAISRSVLLTAKHCGITQDHPLISMTGDRPHVVRVIDVPNTDAQAVVSDATDLVPFSIGPLQVGAGVTVYGYGRSREDPAGATVMRRASLGNAHAVGADGSFHIDVPAQGDTVCEGDSGAPGLQGNAVTTIIVSAEGPPCGVAYAIAVPAQPAFDWLKSQGIL